MFKPTQGKPSPKIHLHFDIKVKVTTLPLVHLLLKLQIRIFLKSSLLISQMTCASIYVKKLPTYIP